MVVLVTPAAGGVIAPGVATAAVGAVVPPVPGVAVVRRRAAVSIVGVLVRIAMRAAARIASGAVPGPAAPAAAVTGPGQQLVAAAFGRDLLQRRGLMRVMRRHGVDHHGRLDLLGVEHTSIMTPRTTKDEYNSWLLIPFGCSWPGVLISGV